MAKKYGIKALSGGISGLDGLLARLDAMPEQVMSGLERALDLCAGEVRAQALNNIAGDDEIPNAITTDTRTNGAEVTARVFVAAQGFDPIQWPVFVEMGTGPHGIESAGGPSGLKYPLPATAYTQEPWTYMGEDGKFHRTAGMYANPYLWPAYQAKKPFMSEIIKENLREFLKKE